MASMTPEERARFEARMKEREAQGGGRGGFGGGPGGQGPAGNKASADAGDRAAAVTRTRPTGRLAAIRAAALPAAHRRSARFRGGRTTIDSLFGPLQTTETRGRAWLYENKQLKSVQLRLGVSDGTYSEVIDGDLKEGQEVVVNMLTGLEPVVRPGQPAAGNPLMGPQRGGPGGGGGGNRGGGGGRGF